MSSDKLKDFTDEMLNEIKDLKDLTKEELPQIAREYINYLKISNVLYLISCLFLFYTVVEAGLYGFYGDHIQFSPIQLFIVLYCIIVGLFSIITIINSMDNILNVFLQPRRTAIIAITSLFSWNE